MNTCVICGKETVRKQSSNLTVCLLGHVETYKRREYRCDSCGETFTSDDQGEQNESEQRTATCRALREIGPDELKALRELVHLTQPDFENAVGVGRNTVARWETGLRPMPPYIKNVIRLLALNPTALLVLREQALPPAELQPDAGAFRGTIERPAALRRAVEPAARRGRRSTPAAASANTSEDARNALAFPFDTFMAQGPSFGNVRRHIS